MEIQEHLMSVDCEDKSTFWNLHWANSELLLCLELGTMYVTQSAVFFFSNHTDLSFPLFWGVKCEGQCATSSCKRQPTVCNMLYEPFCIVSMLKNDGADNGNTKQCNHNFGAA